MFHTKDSDKAIKRFVECGGGMAVSACGTYIVASTEDLADMGFGPAYQSSVIALSQATKNWSLDAINDELGAACHYSQHTDIAEAREALVAMLMEFWVE